MMAWTIVRDLATQLMSTYFIDERHEKSIRDKTWNVFGGRDLWKSRLVKDECLRNEGHTQTFPTGNGEQPCPGEGLFRGLQCRNKLYQFLSYNNPVSSENKGNGRIAKAP
jgi:hypothetical protein